MKVSELMTPDLVVCDPDTNLAEAAKLMWDRDCGILPIVDQMGHVAGLITDRDVCMAVATKGRLASRISVTEVASGRVVGVSPDADIAMALKTMADHQVHRLPVIDDHGMLKGMVSMNDVILFGNGKSATPEAIVETMRAVCKHRKVELAVGH